ncbi:MAG: hypothetical protein V9G08_01535 [Dermatophilaceae bacterium]
MRLFTDRPATRWAVPIFAVVALATGASLASVSASADPNLPDRTAAQLLVDVRGAGLHAGSGTVVQTSDLGLPELPGVTTGGSGSQPVTSLLGGSHTWRVWYAGPTKARVALVGSLGETDVIRNGQDAWVWDSAQKEAVHYTLPAEDHPAGPVPTALASQLPMTPDEAAAKALAAIEPTTTVTTAKNVVVAGRPAYELVLTPKGSGSLVASVHIAVDGALYVPLRVQVYSTKRTAPAFEVGFTQVGFDTPEDRQFEFVAPPDTSVRNGELPGSGAAPAIPKLPLGPGGALPGGLKVVGSGWSTVLVVNVPPLSGAATASGTDAVTRVLAGLPRVSGRWGWGHLLEGTLFSAVVADDGRIALGPVAPDLLYAALAPGTP